MYIYICGSSRYIIYNVIQYVYIYAVSYKPVIYIYIYAILISKYTNCARYHVHIPNSQLKIYLRIPLLYIYIYNNNMCMNISPNTATHHVEKLEQNIPPSI